MNERVPTAACSCVLKSCSGLFTLMLLGMLFVGSVPSKAQTYTVLHSFNGSDGHFPQSTLAIDVAGNLYGTTTEGGAYGFGTVFRMSQRNGAWVLSRLYSFQGGMDGAFPWAGVTIGADGTLLGTTNTGGGGPCDGGCGTVFSLRPPITNCPATECPWVETVIHRFGGGSDGAFPGFGSLSLDATGRVYGTTTGDYGSDDGTVFRFAKSSGQWTQTVLHSFTQGEEPYSGVTLDRSGNVYGTTTTASVVYELEASQGYFYQTLYTMPGGQGPLTAGLAFDSAGNLYGATLNDGGSVFQLHPTSGQWSYTQLEYFGAYLGLFDAPTVDPAGNVYGTVNEGPGTVFKLSPSGGGWALTTLHDFDSDPSSGLLPVGGVTLDAGGNLYGTATYGGTGACQGGQGCGVVWQIVP